jgi:hypothetical protein
MKQLWLFFVFIHLFQHIEYVVGLKDRTVCFHCGDGLKDWKRTVVPRQEHAAWFPFCVYASYIKGATFVSYCHILRLTK